MPSQKPGRRAIRAISGRPLREIAMEPSFIAAAVAGMIAYGVMSPGDDGDADRDARLRARICRRRFCYPVALAWHVRSELYHRPLIGRLGLTLSGTVLLLLCSLI